MILETFISRRYLFSKKSTNAINLITGLSILGIAVGTATLILELAVFNGFENLLSGLFNQFNPELKITPKEGKFFGLDSTAYAKIKQLKEIEAVSLSLEETALFDFEGNIAFATIKGVDEGFLGVTDLDSTLVSGEFILQNSDMDNGAVLGLGVKNKLGVSLNNPFGQLKVYMPKKKKMLMDQPFKISHLNAMGVFSFQQDYDNQYVFTSLSFVERLISKKGMISSIEISIADGYSDEETKASLIKVLPEGLVLKNRYEQDEAFFKLMRIEKWLFYALFLLTLILITFNIIGALWMIVLDKKRDIAVLKSLGTTDSTIGRIFLFEGGLISLAGMVLGFGLALVLYWYHVNYGLISIPDGFIIDRYPMELRIGDFVITAITMFIIGVGASLLPARRAQNLPVQILDE